MHTLLSQVGQFIQVSTSGFQTDNRYKLHFDWMIKRKHYRPLRYQQIEMYTVWGYGVVYSGKFIDDYEYKNNPWIQHGLHSIIGRMVNECMLDWVRVCVFHLSWRTSVYILNNSQIGPPPGTFLADTRQNVTTPFWRHSDVIASCAHCVYVVLILIFFIACRWVTQRGYSAVLCKKYVFFCLLIVACLVRS